MVIRRVLMVVNYLAVYHMLSHHIEKIDYIEHFWYLI